MLYVHQCSKSIVWKLWIQRLPCIIYTFVFIFSKYTNSHILCIDTDLSYLNSKSFHSLSLLWKLIESYLIIPEMDPYFRLAPQIRRLLPEVKLSRLTQLSWLPPSTVLYLDSLATQVTLGKYKMTGKPSILGYLVGPALYWRNKQKESVNAC